MSPAGAAVFFITSVEKYLLINRPEVLLRMYRQKLSDKPENPELCGLFLVGEKMAYEKQIFSGEELNGLWDYDNYSDQIFDNTSDTCCSGQVCDPEKMMRFDAVFIPVLYTLTLLVGLLGNGLVLAILCQMRRTWSITDTFILHLSVADLLLLITLPFWAAEAVQGWKFGTPLCKLMGAIFKINFFCGIFLLACISLDRYLSIVHAVQMYSRRKPWQVQASCLFVWFFCLILSVPDWVFLEGQYDSRSEMYKCEHNYSKYSANVTNWRLASRLLYHIVGFLIPSVVMVFCYSCILLRLHRGSQGIQKQRAIRVILVLVVAFFICWTPFNITLIVNTLHANDTINRTCESTTALDISMTATTTLGYMHCCLNPILYAFVGIKFRNQLLEMLKALGCRLHGQYRMPSRKSSVWSESGDTSYTSGF
ncbi:C-X-C chemokine receptor type 3-like isoform X1 [Paramormyrops kingsleyae]